jgi:hypothetical protein
MAQAVRSLSPKRIAERMQQHRQAVMILAHRRAKKAVERELQSRGLKPRYIAPREINQLAHDYLAQHRPELSAEAGATFKSLGDGWADTTTPHGRLMLTVLGGLAGFERFLIQARTSKGRQRAQQRGVRFGRKPKLTVHQQQEALARRARGEALVDIARTYNVSHSTISRLA